MRMLLQVRLPNEPFNTYIKDGSVGQRMKRILEEIKPEAAYFVALDGTHGDSDCGYGRRVEDSIARGAVVPAV